MKKYLLIIILLITIAPAVVCDLNNDDELNIIDIVIMVNSILTNGDNFCDMNGDNELDIIDIVQSVNAILLGFNMEFITIPGGDYYLPGNDEQYSVDYSYQIGKYEVTNQQYLSYLNNAISSGDIWIGNCIQNIGDSCVNGNYDFTGETIEKSYFVLGDPRQYEIVNYQYGIINWVDGEFQINDDLYLDHPVIFVSWFGAGHFAQFNGYRLPTYDEWIRAARAETTWKWPWGNNGSNMFLRINTINSQFGGDVFQHPWPDGTTPVGLYNGENGTLDNASTFGLYDLLGNTWEWISDPILYNNELRKSLGGSWDGELSKSKLKWVVRFSEGHPTWSTGFRVVKDN